jgi:PAS domain S-box-containing protein
MKLTIRNKIFIGFTILLALSSLIQAFTFIITRNYISSQIDNFQSLEAKKGAGDIQNFFTTLNEINFGLSRAFRDNVAIASSSGQDNLASITKYTVLNNDHIRKITYLTINGRELYKFDINGQVAQDQLSYEVYTDPFKNAVSGKTSFSKVYYFEHELGPHIDIFSPIFDSNRAVSGVLKMEVSLEALRKSLETVKYGTYEFLYIVDDEGRLIAHPSQQYVLQRPNLISRKIIAITLHGLVPAPQDYRYKNENNIEVLAKAEKVPGMNWIVVVEQPVSEAYGFLTVVRNVFIITLIGSTLVLFSIAFLVSESLASGIKKLQKSAEMIEKGELKTGIVIKSGDEIESLSYSFASVIDKLLQRENQLKKEKQETETLLQSLTDGVVALDQDNKIIAFNKAAQKVTGLLVNAALGKHVDDVLLLYNEGERVPFATYHQQTYRAIDTLKEKTLELVNAQGKKTAIALTTDSIVFKDQRIGSIIAFHDVTKEKELEEMKLDFVSMAAHELRTPLTSIRGYLSVFLEEDIVLNNDQKMFLKRMNIACDQLMALVENLLNITRIERGVMSLSLKPLDWVAAVRSVIDQLQERANQRKITITLQDPQGVLLLVNADQFRISEVVANLLANAINYTEEGGSVTISFEEKNGEVVTHIVDTGEGIPKEALAHLFTKFFRVSGKLEQGSKGTGLGLYIAKAIVEMHYGKIWVESELGKGSIFSFSLPEVAHE